MCQEDGEIIVLLYYISYSWILLPKPSGKEVGPFGFRDEDNWVQNMDCVNFYSPTQHPLIIKIYSLLSISVSAECKNGSEMGQ